MARDPALDSSIYAAGERFVAECLREDGSLFTPGVAVWSSAPIDDFYARFVTGEIVGGGTFMDKLHRQLEGASDETIQFAAEALFFNYLCESDTGADHKRKLVTEVLSLMDEPVAVPPELDAAFADGVAGIGQAKTQKWQNVAFLVEFARAWKQLDAGRRDALLGDPSDFRVFVQGLPKHSASIQIEGLLYLVFPDLFETSLSMNHKHAIVRAFAGYAEDPSADVDSQLASIRAALEEEYGEGFTFYDEPLLSAWRSSGGGAGKRAWFLRGANDRGVNHVPAWLEEGFVSIGWEESVDARPGMSVDELRDLIARLRTDKSPQWIRMGAGNLDRFFHQIEAGDLVVTVDSQRVFVGEVEGEPELTGDGKTGAVWRRGVRWLNAGAAADREELPEAVRSSLKTQVTLTDITKHRPALEALVGLVDIPEGAWAPFLDWAERLYEYDRFDENERDYKLAVAAEVKAVQPEVVAGTSNWPASLRRALTANNNNLIDWRARATFLDWCAAEPELASTAIKTLWDGGEPAAAIDAFMSEVTSSNSPGNLVAVAAVLLMGADPAAYVPYRSTAFEKARKLLRLADDAADEGGERSFSENEVAVVARTSAVAVRSYVREHLSGVAHKQGGPVALSGGQAKEVVAYFGGANLSRGGIYASFLALLDELTTRLAARGVVLRDRLDAQGLAWWIGSGSAPPEEWPEDEKAAFLAYQQGSDVSLPPPPPGLAALARKLTIAEADLQRMIDLIERKRAAIFYGPPGTGKTYVALELARFLAADAERTKLVQFHPSYAYEDFVEGFRPDLVNGQPGFRLTDGPFKEVAQAAADDPDHTYVLVIDELNRGNVAKVFGELYFLLEYRREHVRLQYSRKPFALPPNLLVIGTMNTADRSIALLDTALRRRFYFISFFPGRPPIKGLLRRWLGINAPELDWVADAVDRANELLKDEHVAIGHSYFVAFGSDLDEDRVHEVWEHSVLPTIEERFFGEPDRIEDFTLDRLREVEVVEEESDEDAPAD